MGNISTDGHSSYIFVFGMMTFSECVLVANLTIINFSKTHYPFTIGIIFLSVLFYISNLVIANLFNTFDSYGVFSR